MSDAQIAEEVRRYYDASYPPDLWGGGGTPPPVDPHIDSLDPNTSIVGQPVTVRVLGSNFLPGAVVEADQSPLPTVFVSSTELTVTATPITSGTASLTVRNPAPNDQESNGVIYTVTAAEGRALTAKQKKQEVDWLIDGDEDEVDEVEDEDES